jgi:hypothetical protein
MSFNAANTNDSYARITKLGEVQKACGCDDHEARAMLIEYAWDANNAIEAYK